MEKQSTNFKNNDRYMKTTMNKTLTRIQQNFKKKTKKINRFPHSFSLFLNRSKPHSNDSDVFQTFFRTFLSKFYTSKPPIYENNHEQNLEKNSTILLLQSNFRQSFPTLFFSVPTPFQTTLQWF